MILVGDFGKISNFWILQDEIEHEWLVQKYEDYFSNRSSILSDGERKRLAEEMLKSQNFDNFLATKFSNVKRYGGEGAEAMMAFFVELLDNANSKCKESTIFCWVLNFFTCGYYRWIGGRDNWDASSRPT